MQINENEARDDQTREILDYYRGLPQRSSQETIVEMLRELQDVHGCISPDMLEQAGFTVDDFTDITWNDFMEKAKVVKEKTGQPILTSQAGSPDLVMEMLQSCGESLFNEDGSVNIVDNKALKPILEIYSQMVKDGTLVEVTDWDQYIASLSLIHI